MLSLEKTALGICVAIVLASGPQLAVAQQEQSLVGTWDLIGYSDSGQSAVTTGSAVFRGDGTLSFVGTVTFPGEPTADINVDGSYEQTADTVVLNIEGASGVWNLEFAEPVVVLTEIEPPPANTITLRRQPTPTAPLTWGRLKGIYR